MRIRAIVTFAVVLVSAAVGLAMTSAANSAAWEPAGQGRRADPGPPTPGPPPGRPGAGPGGIERLLFQLDLTAAQLEQVKSLMQAQREASAPYQQALRDIGNQMRQAVESAGFDETVVRALAAKEAEATVELRVIEAKTQAAIFQLLTDEQKAALSDARDTQSPPRPRRGRTPALMQDPLAKGGA